MPKVDPSAVGRRIRRLREKAGLTQAELGGSRYTPAYVSIIESGKRQVPERALAYIADKLGVDVGELLSGRPKTMETDLLLELHESRKLIHENLLEEAADRVQRLLRQARRFRLARIEANALEALGELEERRDDLSAALERYRQAEDRWSGEPQHLAYEAVCGVARCTQQLGDPRLATHMLHTYITSLEAESMPDPTALMRANSSLVAAYFAAGAPEQTAEPAARALQLQRQVDNAEQIACMNINVARSLLYQGRIGDAMTALQDAERSYAEIQWEHDLAQVKIAQGIVLAEKEEYVDSKRILSEAVAILKKGPNALDQVRAVNELARVERLEGNLETALEWLGSTEDLLGESDLLEQAAWNREKALAIKARDLDTTEKLLKAAAHLYRQADAHIEVASTFRHLAELREARGDLQGSLSAYRDAVIAIEERRH